MQIFLNYQQEIRSKIDGFGVLLRKLRAECEKKVSTVAQHCAVCREQGCSQSICRCNACGRQVCVRCEALAIRVCAGCKRKNCVRCMINSEFCDLCHEKTRSKIDLGQTVPQRTENRGPSSQM